MSSTFKKFTLAAGLVLSLGYLVGCGTRGENTGFGENRGGGGAGSLSNSAAAAGSGTGGSITGGGTGTATVNDAFPLTAVTGLTVSNMLATAGGSGNSNPPTRLGFCNLTNLPGRRVVAVQGFGVPGQGRVVIMPRNPESVPGTSNVVLNPTGAGSDATALQNLNNPFGLLVDGQTIYITDNSTNPIAGRIMVYDNIESTGVCRGRQILPTPPLANPVKILKDGNFLYVAENQPRGAGGRIRKIDLSKAFNDPTNSFILIDNVNNPTSMALDKSAGRNFLYIAENGANSATGAQGGIARVDLNTAPFNATTVPTPLGTLTTSAGGAVASPGVTFITATVAFNNPFDLAADAFGNIVTTEGIQAATSLTGPVFPTGNGKIRVIPGTVTGGAPGTAAIMVLQNAAPGTSVGITGSRGVSLNSEDGTGAIVSAFFTEGASLTTTLRQLTFRTTDGAIFRHLQLDSGKIAPLDTLFDAGDTAATPVIRPNVKYTIGSFNGGANGAVLDVR